MRTYKITGPDGKEYSIDGPEGATREQVIAKIQERLAKQSAPIESDPYKATARKQSTLQNLAAGAGGGLYGLYLGAKQMLGKATPQEIEDHRKAMEGLRSTTSGTVGEFAGNVAGALPAAFIPGANTYVGSALIGGGLGALRPTMPEESKVDNAILGAAGGVAGNAIGRGISSLFKPVPRLPSETRDAAVKTAESLGMKLTPGDKTQSLALQQIEAVLSRTPGGSGIFDRAKDLNQKALNKIAAQTIGENTDELSAPVIAKAADRINKTFNELSAKSNVKLTDSFNGLIEKLKNTNDALGPFRNPQVDSLIEKSTALAQMKQIPGNVYQTIRSELTSSADDAFRSGNSGAGRALKDIRNALDDAAKNGLSKADQELWDTVRKQYAHLNTLVKGNVVSKGNVNPALVKNEMIKFNNKLYKSGKNESPLAAIGNVAENFKQMVPNSGTPEQTLMRQMMFGNPLTGLPITGAANLYSRLYMSQPVQNYLTKGIVDLSPELQRALALSGALSGASLGSTANQ